MTKEPNRNKAKREFSDRMVYSGKPAEFSRDWKLSEPLTRFLVGFGLVALIYIFASYAGI